MIIIEDLEANTCQLELDGFVIKNIPSKKSLKDPFFETAVNMIALESF